MTRSKWKWKVPNWSFFHDIWVSSDFKAHFFWTVKLWMLISTPFGFFLHWGYQRLNLAHLDRSDIWLNLCDLGLMSSRSNNVTNGENPPICFCTRIIKNFTKTRTRRMNLRKRNQRSGKFCILNTPSELTSSERCAPDVTVCPPTNFLGEISSTIIS